MDPNRKSLNMLQFDAYHDGEPAAKISLGGANLLGQEGVPLRGTITADKGRIVCTKQAPAAAALALLWDVGDSGRLLLSTTRLPDRATPYNLNLELARARMMSLIRKREDWGLIDYPSAEDLEARSDEVGLQFIEAVKLNATDPAAASKLADACLADAVALSEQTALFHADIFLNRRRRQNRGKPVFGCEIHLAQSTPAYQQRLIEAAEFINLPTPWKLIEPEEGVQRLDALDTWVEWCAKRKLPLSAGPLLDLDPSFFPERIFIWEHDFEAIRELIYDHIQLLAERYAKRVGTWKVISGAHAFNGFNLSFEQIMELTRMSCSLVKKVAPRAAVVIELALPWGEYTASTPRTIPPMMYVDMCIQSGVRFDAFGVQMFMGAAAEGMYVRDMMQISAKLDEFATFGKPLHITGCSAPSAVETDPADHWEGRVPVAAAGSWRQPWSPTVQADWLEMFYRTALSKPFVSTVCWRDLADYGGHFLPHGGLCNSDMTPKPAHDRLRKLRAAMTRRADRASGADQTADEAAPPAS